MASASQMQQRREEAEGRVRAMSEAAVREHL